MLYQVTMPDESIVIVLEEEFSDLKKALDYMGLNYQASVIEEKMYAIHWFDHLDETWLITWCTEENYKDKLQEIIDAEVKYEVTEYN